MRRIARCLLFAVVLALAATTEGRFFGIKIGKMRKFEKRPSEHAKITQPAADLGLVQRAGHFLFDYLKVLPFSVSMCGAACQVCVCVRYGVSCSHSLKRNHKHTRETTGL